MPKSWEGALTTLIPEKVGEENILKSIRQICLMNTAAKIVTSIWANRLSKSLEQQSVFEGLQEGFRPDRSTHILTLHTHTHDFRHIYITLRV